MLPLLEDSHVGTEHVTFTWFKPTYSSSSSTSTVTAEMREPASEGPGMTAVGKWLSESTLQVVISAHDGPVALSLPGVDKPQRVEASKEALCPEHVYNPVTKTLDVVCQENKRGVIITVDV
jgi:hypothetical protein